MVALCGAAGASLAAACASVSVVPIDRPETDGGTEAAADAYEPPADGATADAAPLDAGADADASPVVLKRVSGHVDYNGPVVGAAVDVLSPAAMSTSTDLNGDFFFYVPLGASVVMKVVAPNLFPMIRGVVVGTSNRIRNFYLAGPPEQMAAQSLGLQFDATKGIVEVDFRNSAVGGYGVALKSGAAAVTPAFGIALDDTSTPQASMLTLTGGDGSTLLLGDVMPASITSFAPTLPDGGVMACKPCDAPVLPVQAGVVTWFDFECGSATDCQ
jgi:hypothetical protein